MPQQPQLLPAYQTGFSGPTQAGADPYPAIPGPQSGSGLFGGVPGPVAMPQPYNDLAAQYPNLSASNSALSQDTLSQLSGELSPGTITALNQAQQRFGVGGTINESPLSLGETDQSLEASGLGQYNALIPGISRTQTVDPATQAMIEEENAINAAAPDPTAVQIEDMVGGLAGIGMKSAGAM